MRELPAVLQAAAPDDVRPEHLPMLPEWWPLDPADGDPLSPEQRKTARHAAALAEARRGPSDGTQGVVLVGESGPPALLHVYEASWAYRLAETSKGRVTYRYSPADSPAHSKTMAVVAGAYAESGPSYITQARADEPEHHGITATPKESDEL